MYKGVSMNLPQNKLITLKDIVKAQSEVSSPLNLRTNFKTWQIQDGIFMGYYIKLDAFNNIYDIYKPNQEVLIRLKADSVESFMNFTENDLVHFTIKQLAADNAGFLLLKTKERLELLATEKVKNIPSLPKLKLLPLLDSTPNALHMFFGNKLIKATQQEIYNLAEANKTNVAEFLQNQFPKISQILFYSLFETTANEYLELMANKCNNLLPKNSIKVENPSKINPYNKTTKIYTKTEKKSDTGRGGLGDENK